MGNNPVNKVDPLGLCGEGKLWYDYTHDYWRGQVDWAKGSLEQSLPWPVAATINTVMDLGMGTIDIPYSLGHLGEGSGEFVADPSIETTGGLISDVGTTASVAGGLFPGANNIAGGNTVGNVIDAVDSLTTIYGSGSDIGTSLGGAPYP